MVSPLERTQFGKTFLQRLVGLGIKALRNSFEIIILHFHSTSIPISTHGSPLSPPLEPLPPDFETPPPPQQQHHPTTMSTPQQTLEKTLSQLRARPPPPNIPSLLTTAKHSLLALNALVPQPPTSSSSSTSTPPHLLTLARSTLEQAALLSIRPQQDPTAFTKYFDQLAPFYALPASAFSPQGEGERRKVTGLYLLLLLTRGDYAGFHCVLEGLEMMSSSTEVSASVQRGVGKKDGGGDRLEEDRYIGYPVRLERWLMEGSYDRVWKATKGGVGVPGEEEAAFSEVLILTIRAEIASCSEKAYPSLPIANAKNLLFLDSEGSVVAFAKERGWVVEDGRIYFPDADAVVGEGEGGEKKGVGKGREVMVASRQVTENAIGYARELETIV